MPFWALWWLLLSFRVRLSISNLETSSVQAALLCTKPERSGIGFQVLRFWCKRFGVHDIGFKGW